MSGGEQAVRTATPRAPGEFSDRPGAALRAAARLYEAAARTHAAAWDRGLLRPFRPPVPVLSIGNLTVGGTGKTPAVKRIAAELAARGRRPVILTRGWGGRRDGLLVLDGRAPLPTALEAGDEPLELAAALHGVPVVVGRRRIAAACLAVDSLGADCLVLDDGFQHRPLARDLDVVLLDGRRPLGNGYLLPAGPLREPPAALARADLIVLTRADAATPAELETSRALIERWAPSAVLGTARHAPIGWREAGGADWPLDRHEGAAVAVVSGLADNAQFARAVRAAGAEPRVAEAFPDHHRYGPADLERVRRAAGGLPIVTTEKDLVRWREAPGFGDGAGWWALVIRFEPATGVAFLEALEARLFAGR
jgi:tetraacyldisaccharide 4'-kinase